MYKQVALIILKVTLICNPLLGQRNTLLPHHAGFSQLIFSMI